MVGVVEGNKAFWVLGAGEDLNGVLDIHSLVGRGMQNQKRPSKVTDGAIHVGPFQIVEELFLEAKSCAADSHTRFALLLDSRFGACQ